MNPINSFQIDLDICLNELDDLDRLLASKKELSEKHDILPFIKCRPHLAAYIGSYSPSISRFDQSDIEYTLYGDFRADAIVGDATSKSFCMIEFEDARENSIFKKSARSTKEWGSRFEHGFSQIVDWLWKIDDMRNSAQGRAIFGSDEFQFMGILIIGRDCYLDPLDRARLKWRVGRVLVNSQTIVCLTFDQLARDLRDSLELYRPKSQQVGGINSIPLRSTT